MPLIVGPKNKKSSNFEFWASKIMKSGFYYTKLKQKKTIKPFEILFKYKFTIKWQKMAIISLAIFPMIFLWFSSRAVPRCQNSPQEENAPEVLKWSPRKLEWRHRAPQMATLRSQKGPAAEGVALKIIKNHKSPKKTIRKPRQIPKITCDFPDVA